MLFSSLEFIFVFLPIILIFYYIIPRKSKNYILFIFSLLFYAWGGVSYTLILIFSIIINYILVKQIWKSTNYKKKWLITGLIFNITLIFNRKRIILKVLHGLLGFLSICVILRNLTTKAMLI